jgi:hypothetical protein
MEVDNKPNQTDPSVDTTGEASEEVTLDDLIKERVAEAIAKQKPKESSVEETKQGGSGSDVATQKDSSSVTDPNKEVLSLVEGVLGRKFDSIEDVKKTLSNLNSLVGDQAVAKARENAQLFDKFVEKWASNEGQTIEEAKKFWAESLTAQATTPAPAKVVAPVKKSVQPELPVEDARFEKTNAEVDELKARLDRADLLAKYPYAADVQEEIAIVAKQKGISQLEAFEKSPFKPLVEAKAKEESKKSPVVTSSNRIGFDQKKVQDLGAKVLKSGNEDDKIALVTALGLHK